jgi:outer membrane protein assembly factor BamB
LSRNLCILLFVCTSTFLPPSVAAQTVPTDIAVTYQINAQHTGVISTPTLSPPLKVKWSVDLGATTSYALIAEGKVFVLAGSYSSGTVNLYALDAQTGNALWGPINIPEGAYWWAAAAYDNGKVFVVPDAVPGFTSGVMYAFDASDGHTVWTSILPGQYSFTAPPSARNGVVYTGGAGSGGTVYAVRETDGVLLWNESVMNGDNSSPVVTQSGIYVSYVCPQTYKFAPATGKLLWHFSGPCEGGGGATPVFSNNRLYVRDWSSSSGHNGDIFNSTTGALVANFDSDFAPAVTGGSAFYVKTSGLTAVSLKTGLTIWSAAPPSGDAYSTPPIVVNGTVYVGSAAGYLLGYKSATGKSVVSANMGYPMSAYETGSVGSPESGLSAGQGILVVPAGTHLIALAH